jgi:hypothetical protein
MRVIIRKRAQRKAEGKDSGFRVRGYPVDPEKIKRYIKRKKESENLLPSLPSPVAGELFFRSYIISANL